MGSYHSQFWGQMGGVAEPLQSGLADELDLLSGRNETAAARVFHRDTVEHVEGDELAQLDG